MPNPTNCIVRIIRKQCIYVGDGLPDVPKNHFNTASFLILLLNDFIFIVKPEIRAALMTAPVKPYGFVFVHIHHAHIFFIIIIIVKICTHFALALHLFRCFFLCHNYFCSGSLNESLSVAVRLNMMLSEVEYLSTVKYPFLINWNESPGFASIRSASILQL